MQLPIRNPVAKSPPPAVDASSTDPGPGAAVVDTALPRPCPTCGAGVATRFCGECGERMLGERDRSLAAFLGEALATLTTFDNRFWRTMRAMPWPGQLTAEYVAGRRRPYVGPVQLFLIFSVFFFVASPWLGLTTTRLDSFLESRVVGGVAASMVDAEAARRDVSHAEVRAAYAQVKAAQERFGMMLAIPFFALVMRLLYRRRSYVEHLAFATHTIGSLLVVMLVYLFALVAVMIVVRSALGLPPSWHIGGRASILIAGVPALGFILLAIRRVYGGALPAAALKATVATGGLWASIVAYEYVLFFTTMLALRLGA